MVAPAGVNGGLPQEPAKAGRGGAELRDAEAAEAEPARAAPADAVPGDAAPANAVPGDAGPGDAGPGDAAPGDAGLAEGGQAWLAEGELGEPDEAGWDAAEERSRDVRPLAVLGIIAGVIAMVGVAVGVLAVVTHGFRPKTVITYRPAAAFGLRPGQCVNSGPNALDVTVLSCARPHDGEVFATFSLPATAWPGAAAVQADASDGCASRFGSYLNPDLATIDLTQEFVYPNQAAWQAGERTVVCEVRATSGRLTGSVRAKD
jgi:Septum formation